MNIKHMLTVALVSGAIFASTAAEAAEYQCVMLGEDGAMLLIELAPGLQTPAVFLVQASDEKGAGSIAMAQARAQRLPAEKTSCKQIDLSQLEST